MKAQPVIWDDDQGWVKCGEITDIPVRGKPGQIVIRGKGFSFELLDENNYVPPEESEDALLDY